MNKTKEKNSMTPKKLALALLGVAIYLLGGVQFMSYVVLSILAFALGSLYRRVKVEYEDYKMLKNVQKSLVKLEDYKKLQDENKILQDKLFHFNTQTTGGNSSHVGGVTLGAPPYMTRVNTPTQPTQPTYQTNLEMLSKVVQE